MGEQIFFISDSINLIKRDGLEFNSPGESESTFIEMILPNRKNMVIGCIYCHPSSKITVSEFNTNNIDPLINLISIQGKLCTLMGDFNIDLMKTDS